MMFRKGMIGIDNIGNWIIAFVLLVIIVTSLFVLKGDGLGTINKLVNFLRFRG